jgi:hypothetical protein
MKIYNRSQLIEVLTSHLPEVIDVEFTMDITRPVSDSRLDGIPRGSAEYMIKSQHPVETGVISISYKSKMV